MGQKKTYTKEVEEKIIEILNNNPTISSEDLNREVRTLEISQEILYNILDKARAEKSIPFISEDLYPRLKAYQKRGWKIQQLPKVFNVSEREIRHALKVMKKKIVYSISDEELQKIPLPPIDNPTKNPKTTRKKITRKPNKPRITKMSNSETENKYREKAINAVYKYFISQWEIENKKDIEKSIKNGYTFLGKNEIAENYRETMKKLMEETAQHVYFVYSSILQIKNRLMQERNPDSELQKENGQKQKLYKIEDIEVDKLSLRDKFFIAIILGKIANEIGNLHDSNRISFDELNKLNILTYNLIKSLDDAEELSKERKSEKNANNRENNSSKTIRSMLMKSLLELKIKKEIDSQPPGQPR